MNAIKCIICPTAAFHKVIIIISISSLSSLHNLNSDIGMMQKFQYLVQKDKSVKNNLARVEPMEFSAGKSEKLINKVVLKCNFANLQNLQSPIELFQNYRLLILFMKEFQDFILFLASNLSNKIKIDPANL